MKTKSKENMTFSDFIDINKLKSNMPVKHIIGEPGIGRKTYNASIQDIQLL